MALSGDLLQLAAQLKLSDALLVQAETLVSKYPLIFTPTVRTEITAARSDIRLVVQELTNGSELLSQIVLAAKGV
jgi:hypothetical protein